MQYLEPYRTKPGAHPHFHQYVCMVLVVLRQEVGIKALVHTHTHTKVCPYAHSLKDAFFSSFNAAPAILSTLLTAPLRLLFFLLLLLLLHEVSLWKLQFLHIRKCTHAPFPDQQ